MTDNQDMTEAKGILASRTVWSNAIGLLAIGLGVFGFDAGTIDASGLADAVVQIVAAGSFIASTVFRVIASRKIGVLPLR